MEPTSTDPIRDTARLTMLRATELLDSPREEGFDRLTRLASRMLRAPVALISLVDSDRQFFKSSVGLPEPWASWRETPLTHSFCQHVVANGKPLIITDARDHPSLSESGAIVDLGVIAYLGVPLIAKDGLVLGSLCAIDGQPRAWTDEDLEALLDLADSVVSKVLLRTEAAYLRRAQARLAAQYATAITLTESQSLDDAVGRVLRIIGEGLDLDVGEFWELDLDSNLLRRHEADWWSPTIGPDFGIASRQYTFGLGDGIPGLVWQSMEPSCIEDLAARSFPRSELAAAHGLHGAIGFLVIADSNVIGIMTFLSRRRLAGDAELMRVLATLGGQIGQFAMRCRVESQVHRLNTRLNAILDAATQVAIISTDERGTIEIFNTGAERLLGYTREELVGRATPDVFHDAEEIQSRYDELERITGTPASGFDIFVEPARRGAHDEREWTYVRKDGERRTVSLAVTAVRDGDGRLSGVLRIARDISEIHRAAEEMRTLVALVEHSSDFIGLFGLDGRVLYVNPAGRELVGLDDIEAARATTIHDYVTKDTSKSTVHKIVSAVLINGQWHSESRLLNSRTADVIEVDIDLFPVLTPRTGQPLCLGAIIRDCRDRKQAEREQLELVALIQNSDDLIATATPDGRVKSLNRAGRRMLGLPLDGPIPDDLSAPFSESIRQLFQHDDLPVVGANGRWDGEKQIPRPGTDEFIDTQASLFTVRNPTSGEPLCLATVQRDITKQKRAEAKLRRSEARLKEAQRLAGLGSWEWDVTANLITYSDELDRIAVRDSNVLARQDSEQTQICTAESLARLQAAMAAILETGDPYEIELEMIDDDASHRWVTAQSEAIRDAQGRITGLRGTVQDITDRRRQQESLRLSEERFRGAFDFSAIGMAIVAPDGGFQMVNRSLCQIVGYSREELVGQTFQDITHPDDLNADLDQLRRLLAGEISWYQMEKRYIHRDGQEIWVILSASVVRDASGQPLHCVAQIQDITARKRFEEELRSARDEAMAATRSKSEFLANMSHELRTPMAAILGYSEMLLDPFLTPSERDHALQAIRRDGSHLLQIINDVLDLSKIEAGKIDLERVSYSPWQAVLEVLSSLRARADERDLILEARAVTSLPASVMMDPTRVRQILYNLVTNAIKFSNPGGHIAIRIGTRAADEDGQLELQLEVEDRGVGMTPEQLEQLFLPFQQADSSTTRRFGGTGLGLSITRRLAHEMGGTVTATSELGQGSCFRVRLFLPPPATDTLWLQPGELATEAAPYPRPGDPLSGHRFSGRILLAEDNPDNQRVVGYHLRRLGLEVEIAENGLIAIEKALRSPFDIILMDMQMPELDGYGAASSLRRSGYSRPIIALTAHAMKEDRDRCLRVGCNDYLTKPLNLVIFVETLANYLAPVPALANRGADPSPNPGLGQVKRDTTGAIESEFRGDPGLRPLIREYVEGLPRRVAELRAALKAGDLGKLESLAHQTKGVGGMYGYPDLTEIASLIEAATRERQAEALLAELIEEFAEIAPQIGLADLDQGS